jgi:hypothetical protein
MNPYECYKAMIEAWTHKVSPPQIQECKWPVATSHNRNKTEIPANFVVLWVIN